uniref:non-specific serine/threonine protein kinase n=1 Tax=Timema cristinae TaxID=61476 RepID=A0A7R9C9B3_TIMCR|nr:unnamed protein product [Timema cristinae]
MDGEDSPPGIESSRLDEFLPTPKRKRKTTRVIRPTMNSRGIELKRNLFQPKESQASKPKKKPTTKQPLSNKPKTKQQQPRKKKTQKTTDAESWYCSVCEEDEVKDMRLCVIHTGTLAGDGSICFCNGDSLFLVKCLDYLQVKRHQVFQTLMGYLPAKFRLPRFSWHQYLLGWTEELLVGNGSGVEPRLSLRFALLEKWFTYRDRARFETQLDLGHDSLDAAQEIAQKYYKHKNNVWNSVLIDDLLIYRGFSTVSLVEDAHTHKYYAVKKIICHGKEDQNIALKEVEFYNLLKHPNIIECIDSTLTGQPDPQSNFTSEVLVILPYYQLKKDTLKDVSKLFITILLTRFPELWTYTNVHCFHKPGKDPKLLKHHINPSAHLTIWNYSISSLTDSYTEVSQEPLVRSAILNLYKGTLYNELDYRSQTKNHLEPQNILNMFLQICEGVKAFHEATPEPLAHRDLKTSNIVIADDRTPIIMDLGSVASARIKICGSVEAQTLQDIASERCSMPYRAPELFNVESYCMIDERTDIWSLGCILYAMCYFKSPFDSVYECGDSVALAVISGNVKFPENSPYDQEMHNLIMYMLKVNPMERPYIYSVIEKTHDVMLKLQTQV